MTKENSLIAVIGAGPMGLACARALLKAGHAVDLYESDDRIGGMSASFDFDGLEIERYYHFICKPDQPLFDLLEELGLSDHLRWRPTRMGFFYRGKLYPWGSPLHLLRFPHLGWLGKFRYALHVFYTKGRDDWRELDKIPALPWLRRWAGEQAYQLLWRDLFRLKFHGLEDQVSAAWIATRIKRVALSRKNLFQEELGYLQGGSATLLDRLAQVIRQEGGRIFLSTPVQRLLTDNQQVTGLRVEGETRAYSAVVSTIPLPYLPRLVPDLPDSLRERIAGIRNIGVACVLLKLKQPLSENFWMNINDPRIELPGLIEYSNLNPLSHALVYAPFYLPREHPKYQESSERLIAEVVNYLPWINPEFRPDWVLASRVSRYEFAQTVCPPGFFDLLPPMRTPIKGLVMADTGYYYPEDRSISESVRVGGQLARAVEEERKLY